MSDESDDWDATFLSEYKLNFIKRTQKKVQKFIPYDCYAVTNDEKQIDPHVAAQWKLSDEESKALIEKIILERLKSTYETAYKHPGTSEDTKSENLKSSRTGEFDSEYKKYLNDLYVKSSEGTTLAAPSTAKREIEDETRDFLTTYNRDYREKKISKRKKIMPARDSESYLEILDTPKSTIEQVKIPVKTIYQYDFCSLYPQIKNNSKLFLPNDWIVPETVYKYSYRDLNHLQGFGWTPNRPIIEKPKSHLGPNLKQREILKITTGDSEYAAVISETGKKLFK